MEQLIKQLESDGYCTLRHVYGHEEIGRALELVKCWVEKTSGRITSELPYLGRDPMVWNLHYKDAYFIKMLLGSRRIEELLVNVLNDRWYKRIPASEPNYILRAYVARSSGEAMPLHIDSFVPYIGSHVISVQCAIVLQTMTVDNGCTLVVRGSHKSGCYVQQESLKDAVPIEAEAGDVVFWDSRVWHGAAPNNSGDSRWVMIATFTRWWIKQAFNITQRLPQEIYKQLTMKERAVLGFCSIPYNDETEGIDMRRGYEALQEDVAAYRAAR